MSKYIILYDWQGGNTATYTDYEIVDSYEEIQDAINEIPTEVGRSYIEVFKLGDDISSEFNGTKIEWQ